MSERHFRRLRDRYEADGAEALIAGRCGRMSGWRVPVSLIAWLLEQYRTRTSTSRQALSRAAEA